MGNQYFKFKQFEVIQDKTAMKVGVDGVLLGAWTDASNAQSILDIGTGTGLLSLMLAQKSNANIDAIEIEKSASEQAKENVTNSNWPKKINVHNISIQEYSDKNTNKYDLIICNPPYFTNSLNSLKENRNIARHDNNLSLEELFQSVNRLLKSTGRFNLIYPYDKRDVLIQEAQKTELFVEKILKIKGSCNKSPNRILCSFIRTNIEPNEEELIVRDIETNDYTDEYKALTKDYYLAF